MQWGGTVSSNFMSNSVSLCGYTGASVPVNTYIYIYVFISIEFDEHMNNTM